MEVIDRGNNSIFDLKIIEEKIQSMNGIFENNIKENEKSYILHIPVANKRNMIQKGKEMV